LWPSYANVTVLLLWKCDRSAPWISSSAMSLWIWGPSPSSTSWCLAMYGSPFRTKTQAVHPQQQVSPIRDATMLLTYSEGGTSIGRSTGGLSHSICSTVVVDTVVVVSEVVVVVVVVEVDWSRSLHRTAATGAGIATPVIETLMFAAATACEIFDVMELATDALVKEAVVKPVLPMSTAATSME